MSSKIVLSAFFFVSFNLSLAFLNLHPIPQIIANNTKTTQEKAMTTMRKMLCFSNSENKRGNYYFQVRTNHSGNKTYQAMKQV